MVKIAVDSEYIENRPAEKQRMREEDQRRIDSGEVTAHQLFKENSFFAALDMSKAKIAYIGKEKIRDYKR